MRARRQSGAAITPLLGLFAYAGFRIIPSANRISMNAGNMRLGRAAIDALHRDAETQAKEEAGRARDQVLDVKCAESIELAQVSS